MDGLVEDQELIRSLARHTKLAPAAIARNAGLAASTVNRSFNGTATTRLSLPTIEKLRATYPDFPGWPQDRLSDRRVPFRGAEPERADTVQIAQYDVAFGMGGSYLHEDYVEPERLTFSRTWLRTFTSSPFDQIFFAQGIGDSMTPTIGSSDIVLIDTAQRTPRAAELIWAVEMHGLGMIKRLRPEREGAVLLVADNPAVTAIPCADGEMNIVGRVVAVVKRL
jgi:phage repressor protein C with HTH and peptisase S24 domain